MSSEQIETPIRAFAPDGLVQLHWQRKGNPSETIMVAQGGPFQTANELEEWIKSMMQIRGHECTKEWWPMVCDSTSDYFVWAKPEQAESAKADYSSAKLDLQTWNSQHGGAS